MQVVGIFILLMTTVQAVLHDYELLVEYANMAAVGYCLRKGLGKGSLGGNDNTSCPLKVCRDEETKEIEVVDTFLFDSWNDVGAGYYAIDHLQKRLMLVFRGTSSSREWMSNLNTIPVSYQPVILGEPEYQHLEKDFTCEGCTVHRGFYNLLKTDGLAILQAVQAKKEEHPDYKLVVVGHSLGAAMALLSGIEFQLMGYEPMILSYAGPKVGNTNMMRFVDEVFDSGKTAEKIENNYSVDKGFIRVSHKGDVIPRLPPGPFFSHGGYEYVIQKRKLPHINMDLERKGLRTTFTEEEDIVEEQGNYLPDYLGKYEHSHYFIKITDCNPKDEN